MYKSLCGPRIRTPTTPDLPGEGAYLGKVGRLIHNFCAISLFMRTGSWVHFYLRTATVMHNPVWMMSELGRVRSTEMIIVTPPVLIMVGRVKFEAKDSISACSDASISVGVPGRGDGIEIRGDTRRCIIAIYDKLGYPCTLRTSKFYDGSSTYIIFSSYICKQLQRKECPFFPGSRVLHIIELLCHQRDSGKFGHCAIASYTGVLNICVRGALSTG